MNYKKLEQIKAPEEWVTSVLDVEQNDKTVFLRKRKRKKMYGMRVAAAVMIGILAFGTCITVGASDSFRSFLEGIFGKQEVSEVHLEKNRETKHPERKAEGDGTIELKENTWIVGENESFISEYHIEGEKEIVDYVYGVRGNGLERLAVKSFRGSCGDISFSFDYATIQNEIYAFNYTDSIIEVFYYINGDIVYAALEKTVGDTIQKGYLVSINLKTNEVKKISGNNMICNFVMSPNGKVILCNHRADGYWTLFDLAAGTEKKLSTVDGYARTTEIEFLDDTHILTLGKPFKKGNTEYYSTYLVNLNTGEVEKEYMDCGEISMQWSYKQKNDVLEIYSITSDKRFFVENVKDAVHIISAQGNYVLFGDLEKSDTVFYLANLEKQSCVAIDIPKKMRRDLEIHLIESEKKILITNAEKAFLVDVSK